MVSERIASYLNFSGKELSEKRDRLLERLSCCELCPRRCCVDRRAAKGFCRTGRLAYVSSYNLHFGEEPPISGPRGSGTIFFTGCSLGCLYCQNYPISHLYNGKEVSAERLAEMMTELQKKGAHNINLVTPTHVAPQFVEALLLALDEGFSLPVVYNSSGYENPEIIALLEGIVDVYMPDAKYGNSRLAGELSAAPDYPEWNEKVLKEMYRQVGNLELDENGVARRGLLVRHLVLPGEISNSREVLRFLKESISPDVFLSLMSQYHPAYKSGERKGLSRRLLPGEYIKVLEYCAELGLENGFRQTELV